MLFFDSTAFVNKPSDPLPGMKKVYCDGAGYWKGSYPNWDETHPDETACRRTARLVSDMKVPLVIDIEHWPMDVRSTTVAKQLDAQNMMAQICDWIHDERPNVRLGFYGTMPIRDYWVPAQLGAANWPENADQPWYVGNKPRFQTAYDKWHYANKKMVGHYWKGTYYKRLADHVDVLFPSLYAFYEDRRGFKDYAIANLKEARIYGKQVYPYIWPEYHDGNQLLRGKEIPEDYWRMIIDICLEWADGLVVWGGWWDIANNCRFQWRDDFMWWRVIREYMDKYNTSTAAS